MNKAEIAQMRTREEINLLVARFKHVLFEFRNGKAYWLRQHHRYLDPEDSPKILIGPYNPPFPKDCRPSNRNPLYRILYTTRPI